MLKGTGKARRQAKEYRRELTLPESILWQQLKRGGTGHHWRKQNLAGPYCLDFYCDVAKLCVEVDGEARERGDKPDRDRRRDAWLAANGVFTLRVLASEVFGNLERVLRAVPELARERAPLRRPLDGPPSPAELGKD